MSKIRESVEELRSIDQASDAEFQIYNDADNTKSFKLDASGLTSTSGRTLSVPDKDGTIATIDDVAVLTTVIEW